jgi:hypothetical protein
MKHVVFQIGDATIQFEMTEEFLQRVRQRFSLSLLDEIQPQHLSQFLAETIKSAADKLEG